MTAAMSLDRHKNSGGRNENRAIVTRRIFSFPSPAPLPNTHAHAEKYGWLARLVHTHFEMRVSNVHVHGKNLRVSDHLPAMLAQDMEQTVPWRDINRHEWAINSSTCHEQSRIWEHFSDIERKKEVAKSKERRKKNSQFHKLLNYTTTSTA